MKESSTYQAILAEGEARGKVKEAKRMLRLLGEGVFGPPDAATATALDGINDVTRLEELCQRMHTVQSWQELLREPTPRRPRGRRRSP
jgi:hypothetical protein